MELEKYDICSLQTTHSQQSLYILSVRSLHKKDNPVDCLRSYGQKPQHRTVHNIYKTKNFVHRIQRVLKISQWVAIQNESNVSNSIIGDKMVLTKPTSYFHKMTLIQYWLHLCQGNKLNICRQGNSDEDQFASTSFLCTLLKVLMLWIICCSVNQNTNLKRILSTHFDNLFPNIHTC